MQLMTARYAFAIILALLVFQGAAVSFTATSTSATPNTARSANSQYLIQLSPLTTFSTDFDIHLSFPPAFSFTNVSACSVTLNGAPVGSAVCTLSSNTIIFSSLNIATTVTSLSLAFTTSTALYSGSFTLTLVYTQPGGSTPIGNSNSALIIVTNAAMTCSLGSTSNIVGTTASNFTLTYTPSVHISAGSLLQVIFPAWSAYTLTNFPAGSSSSVCGGQCTIRSPNTGQGLTNQILTYSSLFPSDTTTTNPLVMRGARNPASTQAISITVNLLQFLSSTSTPSYMSCTTSFQVNTAGSFASISFSPSNNAISGSSTISLFLSMANPISSLSYLEISYGSDMQLGYNYVTSNQQTTQVSVASGSSTKLLIGNLTNSTSQVTSLFMASFTLQNPPYASLPNTISFLTQNLVSGTYYSIDSGSVSVSAVVSTITTSSASMSISSIGVVSDITVSFTTINALTTGSNIIITVPTEVTLTTGTTTCSCTISSTCSLINSTSILVNINALTVAAATNVPVTIQSATNPVTTTPTSSFIIQTYYTNTSTPVDSLNSGLTLTATAVTLFSGSLASSSLIVSSTSTYTLTLQVRNALPSGSYMTVAFPVEFPATTGVSLTSFRLGATSVATCQLSTISSMKFNFSNCFPSNLAAQGTITIALASVVNPLSTKPSSSLQIQTYSNNLLMEYMYTGLTITMTTPAALNFASITPADSTTNVQTNYALALTFSQTHYSGDSVILTIPSTISLNTGFACTTTSVGLSVTCIKQSTQVLEITINITNNSTWNYTSAAIVISNMQNNWYAGSFSFNIQTTTNDTATTYYVQQGSANAAMTPGILSATYTPTNTLVLLSSSTLTLTITSPFSVSAPDPTLLKIAITIPTDFTPTSTCTGSLTGSVCSLSATTYSITGLSLFTNAIDVTFTATAGYFTNSSTFLTVLTYNSFEVAKDGTLFVTPFCTEPCKACTNTPTQCTSCLPTPYTFNNYLLFGNSTCLTACPDGYYLPNGTFTCAQCDTTACLTCTATATTCSSCSTPTFLMNTSCLLTCPNTYYGSGTTCVPCINQCFNCTNATYCLSCSTGYNLNPDNTCLTSCPASYISLSSICTACGSPCATCQSSITNCSSCITGYVLFNFTCITTCPDGRYLDANNQCQLCNTPCQFCSAALVCTSCIANHYLYNSSQCVVTCPSGTYGLTVDCQPCASTCQSCSTTSTNCTSCLSGQYLYANKCYTTCPTLTYPYQGNCTTCVSPCATCLNGAFSCSTCISGYLLLNTSCVLTCPSSGYVLTNNSCVACPSFCITCASSTSCSACESSYLLYQGGCVSSCPSTSPIIVSQACTPCATECATCSQSPTNCLTCTIFYYKYSYTCVQTCPPSYYANQITFQCQSGLDSKIVYFPVLITYIVVIFLLIVIKICANTTSLPTSITAFSGFMQIAIWCYLLSLTFATYLQPGINYTLPKVIIVVALLFSAICNFLHFKINLPRLENDTYIKKWQNVNVNHTYFVVIRWVTLFTHHKFFRIIYSKIFNSLHFSMVAFKRQNLFPVSTAFTIAALLLTELPVLAAAFYLVYNKLLKDQIFFTSVQTLLVTAFSIIISLIDIYKADDYFQDTEFMITKRYIEKVNNMSDNKLEYEYKMKEEGSVDGQRQMGTTGGKFIFTKRAPGQGSMGELFFQEQSDATDFDKSKKDMTLQVEDIQMEDNWTNQKSLKSPKSPIFSKGGLSSKNTAKINIFQPIQEEQAEYYEVLKYDEQDFKTAAKLQKQKIDGNVSEDENELQEERKMEFGLGDKEQSHIDDNMSLMGDRERKEEWNKIIDHRQKIAQHIFNTVDTKELYKIQEPLNEDEDEWERQLRLDKRAKRERLEKERLQRERGQINGDDLRGQTVPVRQRVFNKTPEKLRRVRNARKKLEEQLRQVRQNSQNQRMTEEEDLYEEGEPGFRRRRRGKKRKGNKQLQEIYLQRLAEKMRDPKKKTMYASTRNFNYEF